LKPFLEGFYCYYELFSGCESLTTAPYLSATIMAEAAYAWMFYNCTSLTEAPALPASNLALKCYNEMFSGCTSLTVAPALPATTLGYTVSILSEGRVVNRQVVF
jgi:hypothetical protein